MKNLAPILAAFILSGSSVCQAEDSRFNADSFVDRVFQEAANKHYDKVYGLIKSALSTSEKKALIENIRTTVVVLNMMKQQSSQGKQTVRQAADIADWASKKLVNQAEQDPSVATEVIPLFQIAGGLNETLGREGIAIHCYEEECRLINLHQQPPSIATHKSLAKLYRKAGKTAEANRELLIVEQWSHPSHTQVINIPAFGEILKSKSKKEQALGGKDSTSNLDSDRR